MTMKSKKLKKFRNKLKTDNKKANAEVEANFANLITLLKQLDPIKLVSQLSLTFLTTPEDQFNDETSDIHKWARWIEFLTGYLLIHSYPQGARKEIDGNDLETVEDLLTKYFDSISQYLRTDRRNIGKSGEIDRVISLVRNDSLYVRGESYPHQLRRVALDLYIQHDDWFRRNLGFTITDAVLISRAIVEEYNRRINDEKQACRERAQEYVKELIRKGEIKKEEQKDLEARIGCYYYFGNSDEISSFSLDELIKFSGYSREICERYLIRLSQEFGYRNPNHPNTFSNPHQAPWDYNTLCERPIVLHNNKYFVPVISILNEVLLHTFYYDLIADDKYWKDTGEKKYGSWLE